MRKEAVVVNETPDRFGIQTKENDTVIWARYAKTRAELYTGKVVKCYQSGFVRINISHKNEKPVYRNINNFVKYRFIAEETSLVDTMALI